MRIGVLSDTHILNGKTTELPKKLILDFKNVSMIIHAGDIVDFSVLAKLKELCPHVKAVWGNMDPVKLKEKLPEKEIIEIGNYRIGITHGWGHPNKLVEALKNSFKKDKVNVIIFGHSHLPYNKEENGILFFNPGSPTDKVFASYNSYGIIEINGKIKASIIKI